MRKLIIAAISIVCVGVLDAAAQTKDRLDSRAKLFGYESVGRPDGPRSQCTAALVARDVVLTAAHCIKGDVTDYVFRAGFKDGNAIATRSVLDVAIPDKYLAARSRGDRTAEIANDVALVRLSSAIHDHSANPYTIARTPGRGTSLTLASYGKGRSEALTLERGCSLHSKYQGGIVAIDCDATFGSSGAPVFVDDHGRPRIFSIVSSGLVDRNEGAGTFGVELSAIVPQLMATLRARRSLAPVSEGARRIRVGERTSGGARFVRPNGG